jgi:hypothetical protein
MKTITIQLSGYDIKTTVTSNDASMSESDFAHAILTKISEAVEDLKAHHTVIVPSDVMSEPIHPRNDELSRMYERLAGDNNSGLAGGDPAARRAAFRADFAALVADLGERQVVAPSLPNDLISQPEDKA